MLKSTNTRRPVDLTGQQSRRRPDPGERDAPKLPAFLNALLDTGLEAERFIEPPPPVPANLLWRL
jgi:hypothetical protein